MLNARFEFLPIPAVSSFFHRDEDRRSKLSSTLQPAGAFSIVHSSKHGRCDSKGYSRALDLSGELLLCSVKRWSLTASTTRGCPADHLEYHYTSSSGSYVESGLRLHPVADVSVRV